MIEIAKKEPIAAPIRSWKIQLLDRMMAIDESNAPAHGQTGWID